MSVLASLLVGATGSPAVAPFALLGLAVERLSISGTRDPYGTTFGLRTGVWARWRVRGRMMFIEVAPHLALTDFGTGMDFHRAFACPSPSSSRSRRRAIGSAARDYGTGARHRPVPDTALSNISLLQAGQNGWLPVRCAHWSQFVGMPCCRTQRYAASPMIDSTGSAAGR